MADGSLFPDAMGALLAGILNPQPKPGPPYVHTVRGVPDCDQADCCEAFPCACACHQVQPTHTLTETDPDLVAIQSALHASIARARANLTPVQRAAADFVADTAGHYLLHGELPATLSPEIRSQLETAMRREGLT